MSEFFQVIQAGGDVAVMALLFVMWRFDRRLLVLETWIVKRKECDHDHEKKAP